MRAVSQFWRKIAGTRGSAAAQFARESCEDVADELRRGAVWIESLPDLKLCTLCCTRFGSTCRRCAVVGWFGKRGQGSPQDLPPQKITTSNWGPSAAPGMMPPDADGISRLFSKELFTGERGEFLKSLGFSPDAVGNIAWTADTFATLDARQREKLEAFVDKAESSLGDGMSVRPLLLVPETVWQSEYRNFLCATCRFYPADPTNVFFLAG